MAKHGDEAEAIDLSSKVEIAPVVIPPGMPMQFVYSIMQEQGLDYVPVIRQHGPLEGIISRYEACCYGYPWPSVAWGITML